jgi:hypothetical protein
MNEGSKSETRSSKQTRKPIAEFRLEEAFFRISNFEFVSNFEFRTSDFISP